MVKRKGNILATVGCVSDSLFSQLYYIDKVTGGGHSIGDGSFITAREKDRYLVKNLMMEDAIKELGKIFTSKQVSADFDINENTARTYLNGLVDEDLLMSTRSKKGKMILYLAPSGLRDKYKNIIG